MQQPFSSADGGGAAASAAEEALGVETKVLRLENCQEHFDMFIHGC